LGAPWSVRSTQDLRLDHLRPYQAVAGAIRAISHHNLTHEDSTTDEHSRIGLDCWEVHAAKLVACVVEA
jgi:hypothetical protein